MDRRSLVLAGLALVLGAAGMASAALCHFRVAEAGGPVRCSTSAFALGTAALIVGAGVLGLAAVALRWPRAPALAALGLAGLAWAAFMVTGFLWWTLSNVAYGALALAAAWLSARPSGRTLALVGGAVFGIVNGAVAALALLTGGAGVAILSALVLIGLPHALLLYAWQPPTESSVKGTAEVSS